MILEALYHTLTPCSPAARKLGYLKEIIATQARYNRCKQAWQPHLEQTQQVILHAASTLSPRTIVILGAGNLLDIPLTALLALGHRVTLVDICFLPHIRQRMKQLPDVTFHTMDVTGLVEPLYHQKKWPAEPPTILLPRGHLVISCNILSQLPVLPLRWLRRHTTLEDAAYDAIAATIIKQHISAMEQCAPERLLITDTQFCYEKQGEPLHQQDALYSTTLPAPLHANWHWHIAPAPELHKDYDVIHNVAAVQW